MTIDMAFNGQKPLLTPSRTLNDLNGTVEFKAYYTHEESLYELHENSYFIKKIMNGYAFGDPITRKIGTL